MKQARGFTLIETMVSLVILLLAMAGLSSLLIQNAKINRSEQLQADVQANARNSLSMVVQRLRSAGWDPTDAGIASVAEDTNLTDNIAEIEIFADFDEDGATTTNDEQVMIRHLNNQIVWRRTAASAFEILADNISNDADGDGTIEEMFVLDATPPTRITVQITAQSPVVDPNTRDFIRYTVSSDVVLRKEL